MPKIKDLPKSKKSKTIKEILDKNCAVCGRKIRVFLYSNRSYRGGHYFGKIPLYTKKEINKALKSGVRKSKIGSLEIEVLKKDPKPYDSSEYWECPKCYWKNK